MMPTENSSVENPKESELLLLGMKEMAPFEPHIDEQNSLLNIFGTPKEGLDLKCTENVICKEQSNELNDCDESSIDKSDINRKLDKEFSNDKLDSFSSAQCIVPKRSLSELEAYSIKELDLTLKELSLVIEKVSSELVQLLLENDTLQQESDARNVAIEQLLKMTVKNSEVELRPIQMSVIIPDNDDSDSS